MLQIAAIREHKDAFAKALKKRNIDALPLLEQALKADEQRRSAQTKLDEVLTKSNRLSKEIGDLFKSGKAAEANTLKEETAGLKEASKELQEQLNTATEALNQILYTLPNIPQDSVPEGKLDTDNEMVYDFKNIKSARDYYSST